MLAELLSEVSHYKRINLGEREAEFLSMIGEGHNSSYRIFSYLKEMRHPMDYKNVNKRVRRLQELGLITETKAKGESIHNAKFFSLTSEGIFYLLTQWQPVSWKWLIEYKNNLILKALLYPYFEENTIKHFFIFLEIGRYLRECCHIIRLSIDVIQGQRREDRDAVRENILRQLQIELERQAKTFAFELIIKETHFLYTHSITSAGEFILDKASPYPPSAPGQSTDKKWSAGSTVDYTIRVKSDKFKVLSKDKKFMALSKNIGKEYDRAFADLSKFAHKNE